MCSADSNYCYVSDGNDLVLHGGSSRRSGSPDWFPEFEWLAIGMTWLWLSEVYVEWSDSDVHVWCARCVNGCMSLAVAAGVGTVGVVVVCMSVD